MLTTNTMSETSAQQIIIAPIMSEKAMQGELQGQYTFRVALDATKVDVKRAVSAMYDVTPIRVRMINSDGKITRFGRFMGRRAHTKKAIVTLPKGKTIAIHEGV